VKRVKREKTLRNTALSPPNLWEKQGTLGLSLSTSTNSETGTGREAHGNSLVSNC